jgi:hypothetical protein
VGSQHDLPGDGDQRPSGYGRVITLRGGWVGAVPAEAPPSTGTYRETGIVRWTWLLEAPFWIGQPPE